MTAATRLHPRGAIASLLVVLAMAVPAKAEVPTAKLFTLDDFAQAFDAVPCDDDKRLAGVKALYEAAGVPPAHLRIERFKDVENLVVTKPGASAETIVIGAHYDKVASGCGAIDNWTGQVVLSRLYQTLRDVPFKKTLVFVAFGREEKGLVGARAMTRAIEPARLADYCAMVNIDSLGLGPPQVADNMSSKKLAALAGTLAKDMEIPFAHARIGGADADSSAFLEKKIPAVTLHGLNNDWSKILHSPRDQAEKVNTASVYLGYRLALLLAIRLDQAPCDAYRQ